MESQVLLAGKVLITPIAKPRPKFRVVKNKFSKCSAVMTYYPGDYLDDEKKLSDALLQIKSSREAFSGPVSVDVICMFQLPKSLSRKEREERLEQGWHTIKPDADNVGKFVCDAMNHIELWKDDCQVADLRIRKWWAKESCISIVVTAL